MGLASPSPSSPARVPTAPRCLHASCASGLGATPCPPRLPRLPCISEAWLICRRFQNVILVMSREILRTPFLLSLLSLALQSFGGSHCWRTEPGLPVALACPPGALLSFRALNPVHAFACGCLSNILRASFLPQPRTRPLPLPDELLFRSHGSRGLCIADPLLLSVRAADSR